MSETDAEFLVVGLGVHGSAAVAALARRGKEVVGLDRFTPGHGRGSSHGRTRMIRRAYPNPVWNDFVSRAFDGWAELEQLTGTTLVHRTGGLYAHAGHEPQLQGPDCRVLDSPEELREAMPGFAVPEGYRAVYDPAAGVIEAERALGAFRAVAAEEGAQLRWGVQVHSWRAADGGVVVDTDDGVLRARRLVLAGGPWMSALVPELAPLLEVWRILTLTAAPGQEAGSPPLLGAFSVDRPEGLVFGIPDADANGVKIGVDAGPVWDPEIPVAAPTEAEVGELRRLLAIYVPELDTEPVETAACLYTMTADKRFVVGPLRGAPEVIVASACSGHGFKFAPALGELLADLATGIDRPDAEFVSTRRRGL
ncbi:sarcosine oxidase [Pseudonocardia thermophila]|uniref:Sarcosine oxidase n=1 Tax=Pseudonocardia thermophila TaxID=1848 RepID=A0A1M6WTJ9_PSETH|nr:N-methyl-L-tryptophan oxidase [Pseudonocardia thermophila]SHK96964.1 sarcosine oxidase [Pseudonocardia thermophila]